MKTALKLNRKQLFELYEKSSDTVKKNLRMEFGETFFVTEKVKPEAVTIPKPKKASKKPWTINWEMIFDFTPILRLALYACIAGLIFSNI